MSGIRLRREPSLARKFESYTYQQEAFHAIKDLEYSAVFHEQGLGKTKIAIDVLLYWLGSNIADTVLVVAKKSLISNWDIEIKNHTHMSPRLLTQNRGSNYYVLNGPVRLILGHYEVLKTELDRLKLFLKTRKVAVILDESTKIKNPESELSKAVHSLAPQFVRRLIMTGTPVANRPFDIWSQIFFLDSGQSLGTDFRGFKRDLDLTNSLSKDELRKESFENSLEAMFSKIKSFAVRKTKADGVLQLPDKVFHTVNCDWEPKQYRLYSAIKEDLKAIVVRNGQPAVDNAEDTLKRLLRLVQIASNPRLLDESYGETPGKIAQLEELLESIARDQEKCIVWTSFRGNVTMLARHFSILGTAQVHGGLSMEERNRSVEIFKADPSVRILVATPGSAKEGLTLTAANHVAFYDRGFGLDDYLQAQDRIHRISQEKTCYVHKLIMSGSIDEWVDVLIESKHLAAQLAQGDITIDQFRSEMSYDFGAIVKEILDV